MNILLLLYSNKKNNKYNHFLDKGYHKQYKYCAFISNRPNTFTLQHTPHDQHGQGVFQYKRDTVFFIQSILRCSWPMLPMHAVILKVVRPLSGLNICLQRVTKNNNKTEQKKRQTETPFCITDWHKKSENSDKKKNRSSGGGREGGSRQFATDRRGQRINDYD